MDPAIHLAGQPIDASILESICRRHGIRELSIFGSGARGELRADSNLDIMVDFDPTARIGAIQFETLAEELQSLTDRRIDLVTKSGPKPWIRPHALRDAKVLYQSAIQPPTTGADLIAALQDSPHRDVEIEPSRDPDPVRDAPLLWGDGNSRKNSWLVTPATLLRILLWTSHMNPEEPRLELLQGTLDLMVLQTLSSLGPLHGYGIARRIEQVSGDEILLNQGTIYAALVRLQQRGWISAEWGVSDNQRKAKFYAITTAGRAQLNRDIAYWRRLTSLMNRVLDLNTAGAIAQ